MSSQKRTRTQSLAAVLEPGNYKRRELSSTSLNIAMGGTAHDRGEPETTQMPAKDREKLGVTCDTAIYCSYEITPLYPSFFRQEVISASPLDQPSAEDIRATTTASPSPAPTSRHAKHIGHVDNLYFCELCFKYTPDLSAYMSHADGWCPHVHAPPGELVYLSPGMPYHPTKNLEPNTDPNAPPGDMEPVLRKTTGYALYEIDGEEYKLFCQNLSLFAKLWVESKSVGYDVGGFTFYLLVQMTAPKRSDVAPDKFSKKKKKKQSTSKKRSRSASDSSERVALSLDEDEADEEEDIPNRIVGYFSKENNSWENNNLACILVFPPWQGQGIGQLLIEASYYLGEREGRFGGPERPLSESGRKSYDMYWAQTVARSLLKLSEGKEQQPTILDVAQDAWIVPDDVIATLKRMDWAEGLLANRDEEKAQRLVVDRRKVSEFLEIRKDPAGLEKDGWLFGDSSGESSSREEDDEDDDDDDDEEGEDVDDDDEDE